MHCRSDRPDYIAILCAYALIFCIVSCARIGVRPTQNIALTAYIEMFVPRADAGKPAFPTVLEIAAIETDNLSTDYNPDQVFKRKFEEEMRDGAVAYFERKGLFTAVRQEGGELSLKIERLRFEAGRKSDPQTMLLSMDLHLINLPKRQEVLYGKTSAQVLFPLNELHRPVNITPPGGGKGWVIEGGAFELAELCSTVYKNIEAQFIRNKDRILKSLNQ